MTKHHAALDSIAANLEEDYVEIDELGELQSKLKGVTSFQGLGDVIKGARLDQFSPLNNPQIKSLVSGIKNQFKEEARRKNLERIQRAVQPVAGVVVAAVEGAVNTAMPAPVLERIPEPFDQYPILMDAYELPYVAAINHLCWEYGELYKVKDGPILKTYQWAPDPGQRKRLQDSLLAIQDEVVRYFLLEMDKLGTNKDNIDLFINNNEAMLDSMGLAKPTSKYEKVMRIYYDLREIIQQRHEENFGFTTNNHKTLPPLAIDDLKRAIRVQAAYVEDRKNEIQTLNNKFKLANNKAEMMDQVFEMAEHAFDKSNRRRIIEILTQLSLQHTIPVSDYLLLEKYFKDERRDDLLGCAKDMVTIEPGVAAIDEQVMQDHTNFTNESLKRLISSISAHLQQMTASLMQADKYTASQRLSLARLHLYILARALPSLAIVSTEQKNNSSVSYVINYQKTEYELLDILSGKLCLFEELTREYLDMLAGLKAASQLALNDFTAEISELLEAYRIHRSYKLAVELIEKLYHHKEFSQDYSRVFNDDELGFLNPIQYGDARVVDQEGVLLKIFSDYEKTIKFYMANNELDGTELPRAIMGFAYLRRALSESGYTYSFAAQLNESIHSIQKFAAAKRITEIYRLGVVDQVYLLSTLRGILKFDRVYREGIAHGLKLECGSDDQLMQNCLERMVTNSKLDQKASWRLFCDEMHDIIGRQDYHDKTVQSLHQKIFVFSERPIKTLVIEDCIKAEEGKLFLTREQVDAIFLILKSTPSIVEIHFGKFNPGNFISNLVNQCENIHTYRFNHNKAYKPGLGKGILLQEVNHGEVQSFHRYRYLPDLPAVSTSQASKVLPSFMRHAKTPPAPAAVSGPRSFVTDPVMFFATFGMSPRATFSQVTRLDVPIVFDIFNTNACIVYETHQPGYYFPEQMVALACDNNEFKVASSWIKKFPNNSPEFLRACFDYFKSCPVHVLKTEFELLNQFVTRLQSGYSIFLHSDLQYLIETLMIHNQGIVQVSSMIGLLKAYLRSFELLNEYNNELIMNRYFTFIMRFLKRDDLREEALKVLRQEAVFYSDYSLDYLINHCQVTTANQSVVREVNSKLVELIEHDFEAARFNSEYAKFSQDLSILVSNPPCKNPKAFVNGLIHYLAHYANRDLGFYQKFSGIVLFILKNKIVIPAELEGAIISRISQLSVSKIKQAETQVLDLVTYVMSLHKPVQLPDQKQYELTAYDQALIDLKVKVLENRLEKLFSLVKDNEDGWVEIEVDKRLPVALKTSCPSIKFIYLYFYEKREHAQNASGSLFAGRYDSLLKQMHKLDILIDLLDALRAVPSNASAASKNALYLKAISDLNNLDKKARSVIRNIFYYETSIVKAVRSLQSWHQTDINDLEKIQQLKNFSRELTSHYGNLLEQMVLLYLQHLPTDAQHRATDLDRLSNFLSRVRSATRDPEGNWSARLFVEVRQASSSYFTLFQRDIDIFFEKLSVNRQLLKHTDNYTIARLQDQVGKVQCRAQNPKLELG